MFLRQSESSNRNQRETHKNIPEQNNMILVLLKTIRLHVCKIFALMYVEFAIPFHQLIFLLLSKRYRNKYVCATADFQLLDVEEAASIKSTINFCRTCDLFLFHILVY